MKHLINTAIAISLMFSANVYAKPEYVTQWEDFAAKTGNPDHAKWAKMLGDPKALALSEKWTKLRGYNAPQLISEAEFPAELKPGLEINSGNIGQMPWLNKYLPKATLDRIKSSDWFKWNKIVIVPTSSYYMPEGTLDQTNAAVNNNIKFNATAEGNLLTPDGKHLLATSAALPFVHPKNGLELNWDYIAHGVSSDNLAFKPVKFNVCDSGNSLERQYEAHLYWQKFHGRTQAEPLGSVRGQEGAVEGGAVYFTKPFDIAGLAAVRIRYADVNKDDNFKAFVPSLRRTRTLTGSDGQDPLAAGLEITWDEWRSYWLKTNPKDFDYVLSGDGFVLTQPETGHAYDPAKMDPSSCNVDTIELELRPVWKLEVIDKNGKYQYSKRIIYIDKENYYAQYEEMYDKQGNLWRVWDDVRDFDPLTGRAMWKNVLEWNPINKRLTHLVMESDWDAIENGEPAPALFNIDRLRDYH